MIYQKRKWTLSSKQVMKSGLWGAWGLCVFKTLSTPSSFTDSRRWRVQPQSVINGYPKHQFTGEDERSSNISMTLHNDFCDLAKVHNQLLAQSNSPESEPLVIGSDVLGLFKCKSLTRSYDETTPEGVLIAVTYTLNLVEVRA